MPSEDFWLLAAEYSAPRTFQTSEQHPINKGMAPAFLHDELSVRHRCCSTIPFDRPGEEFQRTLEMHALECSDRMALRHSVRLYLNYYRTHVGTACGRFKGLLRWRGDLHSSSSLEIRHTKVATLLVKRHRQTSEDKCHRIDSVRIASKLQRKNFFVDNPTEQLWVGVNSRSRD